MSSSAGELPPFASIDELRAEHAHLLASLDEKAVGQNEIWRIRSFVARAAATGHHLDARADRRVAQGFIDYWSASLQTEYRTPQAASGSGPAENGDTSLSARNVRLAEFDARSSDEVVTAAERAFDEMSSAEQEIARRVLLCLVRLDADGRTFSARTQERNQLAGFGDPAMVDHVVAWLRSVGVIVVRSGTPSDQISLRQIALTRTWPRLSGWLEQRRQFRQTVAYWQQHAKNPGALIEGKLLDEARSYDDMDSTEREYIEASRTRELSNNNKLRAGLMIMAVFAMFAAGAALWGWNEAGRARKARDESITARRAAESERERAAAELSQRVRSDALFAEENKLLREILNTYRGDENTQRMLLASVRGTRLSENALRIVGKWPEALIAPYDPRFLDAERPLPLPTLSPALRVDTYNNGQPLEYFHYSLVLHTKRALALYTAANYDRVTHVKPPDSLLRVVLDPRVSREFQVADELYANNDFDRSTLVARADVSWGDSPILTEGKVNPFDLAVNVYPNMTPQYYQFNRNLWVAVENWARTKHNPDATRVVILTGPVFRDTDYLYRGVRIPQSYWKIVVSRDAKESTGWKVDAFMADQYDIKNPQKALPPRNDPEAIRTNVAQIERLTGLKFDALHSR